MKFNKPNALVFIPDNKPEAEAFARTTVMGIGAHQDDLEIMCFQGILDCFGRDDAWFHGVVVTNGAGSARTGLYAQYTDEQMQAVRKLEQKKAAYVGEYGAMTMLDYTSGEVKDGSSRLVIEELKELIRQSRPKVIFTHNLADKHETHIGVALRVIAALRELGPEYRPEKIYGCEVWRNLDWMNDSEKCYFDVHEHPSIAAAVLGVHDSQIAGGKRYDLATTGRRLANATYAESHGTDTTDQLAIAMNLLPVLEDPNLDLNAYVQGYIRRFSEDVAAKLTKFATK